MINIRTTREIRENLVNITGKVLYLFDIDNTIITTKSNFGEKIDKLKSIKDKYIDKNHIDALISSWRLTREVILTDSEWPSFLQTIDSPYALTKMDVGRFSKIDSMENWRNNELDSLNIQFKSEYPIDGKIYSQPRAIGVENATFFNGIFYVGNASKGGVVSEILTYKEYDQVVFIDDRIDQLEDVGRTCRSFNVKYLPMQFVIENKQCEVQSQDEIECEKEIIKFLKLNSKS